MVEGELLVLFDGATALGGADGEAPDGPVKGCADDELFIIQSVGGTADNLQIPCWIHSLK